MERPELISGIKNAIERGYSLDLAIQSFINAGYSKQDVQDSARSLGGVILQPNEPIFQVPQPQISQPQPQKPQVQQQSQQPRQFQSQQNQPQQQPQQSQPKPTPLPISKPSQIPQAIQQPITTPQIQQSSPALNPGQIVQQKPSFIKNYGFIILLIAVLAVLLGALVVTLVAREWVAGLLGLG